MGIVKDYIEMEELLKYSKWKERLCLKKERYILQQAGTENCHVFRETPGLPHSKNESRPGNFKV